MNYIKIALAGTVRSGKDSVGAHLEKEYEFTPFAFGDELKRDFHITNPHIPAFPKPVEGYQLHGKYRRYTHGEDIWINLCFKEIDRIHRGIKMYNSKGADISFNTLITDLRQPNELERLRKEGYLIIRVDAPLELRKQRMMKEGDKFNDDTFKAETENYVQTFDVDYDIINDGTLTELYEKVDHIMLDIFKKRRQN